MRVLAVVFCFFATFGHPLKAQGPDEVVLQLSQSPGGLVDNMLQVVARHLPDFLPGNPSVTVQRVPGAAGLNLLRRMEASDRVDGSVIGLASISQIVSNRMDPETGIHSDFRIIGALSREPSICMVHKDRDVLSAEQLFTTPLKFGAMSPTSSNYIDTAVLRNSVDADIDIITGFQGGAEAMMALRRGEIDGACGMPLYSFLRSPFSAETRIIGYLGPSPSDTFLEASGESLIEYIPSDLDREAINFLTSGKSALFSFWLHPDTPDSIVNEYSAAIIAMTENADFRDEISKVIPVLQPSTGADVEALIQRIADTPDEVVERARELSQ